jgi:hypothetical protein
MLESLVQNSNSMLPLGPSEEMLAIFVSIPPILLVKYRTPMQKENIKDRDTNSLNTEVANLNKHILW